MAVYILGFDEIDGSGSPDIGGKGANLAELVKAGFPVPPGFCVTTAAYRQFVGASREIDALLDALQGVFNGSFPPPLAPPARGGESQGGTFRGGGEHGWSRGRIAGDFLEPTESDRISELGKKIRDHLTTLTIPEDVREAILEGLARAGMDRAYAIRSSATAEDLPTASFAGQQETYLNVIGEHALLHAIQKCWASLFTDRAIAYRAQNGFDHRSVFLSVVVQRMIFPEVSGIMFTADPVTGNRNTVSIDAGFGLGEAFVSGIVSADLYQVRDGRIIKMQIAEKKKAIYPKPGGGTLLQDIPPDLQSRQALPDAEILELAALGQRIEKHFGSEQDIEWCFAGSEFFILQSRPITSLFPKPVVDDGRFHIFLSFAHTQMMMDAMKPMAISVWQTLLPFDRKSIDSQSSFVREVGGRLFMDVTEFLHWRPLRRHITWKINNLDELMGNALERVQASVAFRAEIPEGGAAARNAFRFFKPILPVYMKLFSHIIGNMAVRDPSRSTERAMASLEKALAECERAILGKSGVERIGKVRETLGSAMDLLVTSLSYASLSFIALPIAGRLTKKWLGEELDVNTLSKSPPGNVTGEMGLMIGDLADIAREYPEVAAYLESADDGTFYRELARVAGGALFKTELEKFMAKYGMRCSGEIDISNRRWREAPTMLVPSILGHIATNAPGEHLYRFARGRVEADEYVKSLLSRLGEKGGEHWKARVLARLLSIFRNTSGLRELPKYAIIRLFGVCRQAILEEARRLRNRGILRDEEDVFYLSLDELVSLLEHRFSGDAGELIASRKRAFARYVKLSPPRLITSEGEVFRGERSGMKAPEGALVGTPVSAGIAEGYVKVVLRPEEARLNKGEILVAPFTDPGWTPLFYSAKAIVVEIGGVMTHGSVIAREYGIPAVVGVEHATRILKDGQRIRVDGTNGFVEILEG